MGKSGKRVLGAVGAVLGFFHPEAFGLAATAHWAGAIYGLSLGTTIWSATHKPKQNYKQNYDNTQPFDAIMNVVDSNARIPVIYGTRKWGGLQTYHYTSSDGKTLIKDNILSEGQITGIYGLCANNLLIRSATENNVRIIPFNGKNGIPFILKTVSTTYVFSIANIKYPDATVEIFNGGPTPNDKTLRLYANGKTTDIYLQSPADLNIGTANNNDYSCYLGKLYEYIMGINYNTTLATEGWVILNHVISDDPPENIATLGRTSCYNNPVSICLEYNRLASKDSYYVMHDGSINQPPPDNYMQVGGYPCMAWTRTTLKQTDKLQGGNPNITAIVQGIQVLDTRTNTVGYSENPAMIVRDYLLNKRYGAGYFITEDMLDEESFKEVADYCDEPVTYVDHNGNIVTEPRYTLNIILNDKKKHIEHLQDMLACFGGFLVFTNNHIALRVEKPEPISYSFTDDTIVENSIEYKMESIQNSPNRYIITYFEPIMDYTGVKVIVEDPIDQQPHPVGRGKIIEKEITLYGCTRQSQALRLGRLYKDLTRLCPLKITFQTTTMAMHLEPGDVVTISKKIYPNGQEQWLFKDFPVRILEIQQENGVYTITAQQYNESIYNDKLGSQIQVKNYTKVPNPFSDTIPDCTDITTSQTYYKQKDGTIISDLIVNFSLPEYQFLDKIEINYSIDDGITWYNAGYTRDNKFTIHNALVGKTYLIKLVTENTAQRKSEGAISEPVLITGKDQPPSDVTNLVASINPIDNTKIDLNWDGCNDVDFNRYSIRYGNNWDNGIVISDSVIDNKYTFSPPASGTYNIMVKAVDNSNGYSSNPAVCSISITLEPSQVNNFVGTIVDTDRSQIKLSWDANSEKNISHYEIRLGDEWDTATVIASQLKATQFVYKITSEGYKTFLIKAVNTNGYYSVSASSVSTQITLRPDAPTNLNAVQEPRDRSMIKISWTAPAGKDIAGYELRYGDSWDTGIEIASTKETTYWWYAPQSGTYNIMVRAKTVAGFASNVSNVTITATLEPPDVTGFTATQSLSDRTLLTLYWDTPNVQDVAYYEIRKGPTWDSGQIIGQRVTGTFFETRIYDQTEQTYWIKAVSVAGRYSLSPASISGIYNLAPAPVTNIQMAQDANDRSILHITWTGITESDLAYYELRVGMTWEDGVMIGQTKEQHWDYQLTQSGHIKVMIKSLNAAGYYSDEAFAIYDAVVEPSDVTGFQALQNGEYVEMYWDKATEPDVVAYEIREGASFDQGSLVASGVTVTEYKVKVDTERQYYYHIKAINRSLHYSQNAAHAMVTVQNLPPKNVIQSYDEIALQSGTHTNTEFGPSLINWQTIGGKWSDYPEHEI